MYTVHKQMRQTHNEQKEPSVSSGVVSWFES